VTPYKILGAPIISLERLNLVIKFCIRVGYINSSNRVTHHQQKGVVMVMCFKILLFVMMQRVARVCRQQLSYLLILQASVKTDQQLSVLLGLGFMSVLPAST